MNSEFNTPQPDMQIFIFEVISTITALQNSATIQDMKVYYKKFTGLCLDMRLSQLGMNYDEMSDKCQLQFYRGRFTRTETKDDLEQMILKTKYKKMKRKWDHLSITHLFF